MDQIFKIFTIVETLVTVTATAIRRAFLPKALIRLADGMDVVLMLVSHFDSCFTIRRLDLWPVSYPPKNYFQDTTLPPCLGPPLTCLSETVADFLEPSHYQHTFSIRNQVSFIFVRTLLLFPMLLMWNKAIKRLFRSRVLWDKLDLIYHIKSLILWQISHFYFLNSVPWNQIQEIWLEILQLVFWNTTW